MYCDGLMEAEAALISILEGEFLSLVGDGITSSNGIIRIEGGVPIAMADSSCSRWQQSAVHRSRL